MKQDNASRIEIGTRLVVDYEVKVIAETLNVPMQWSLEGE